MDRCDAGLFANVTGLSRCYSCLAGRYSVKNDSIIDGVLVSLGATVCSDCGLGQFTSVVAQVSYAPTHHLC